MRKLQELLIQNEIESTDVNGLLIIHYMGTNILKVTKWDDLYFISDNSEEFIDPVDIDFVLSVAKERKHLVKSFKILEPYGADGYMYDSKEITFNGFYIQYYPNNECFGFWKPLDNLDDVINFIKEIK